MARGPQPPKNRENPSKIAEGFVWYLANISLRWSIRAIALEAGVAPSTVSRQCKKIEKYRDDYLIDFRLNVFDQELKNLESKRNPENLKELHSMLHYSQSQKLGAEKLESESLRILRRLSEKNSFLLLSPELENAAVFRENVDESLQRLAVTSRTIVDELLLREWIKGSSGSKVGKYIITPKGRSAFKKLLRRANPAQTSSGFAEAQAAFGFSQGDYTDASVFDQMASKKARVNLSESPLATLARKKDALGYPYITHRQVSAGERLREDFEVAQMGAKLTVDWDRFLEAAARGQFLEMNGVSEGARLARVRINQVLKELGPDLSDVVFRCCCYLEGLETIEKKLGWPARSGKVVLKIALDRLANLYKLPADKK